MKRRTRTLDIAELVQREAGPQTRQQTIGLYDVTTKSQPLDIPLPKAGEHIILVDDPLSRVRQWLDEKLHAIGTIRADPKQPPSVKTFAERCSVPATRLHQLLREMNDASTHNAQFVAHGMEIAAELADEWHSLITNLCLEKPVTRYRKSADAGRANAANSNAALRTNADQAAFAQFTAWQTSPKRRAVLAVLTQADQLKLYLRITRPNERVARRLRAMLADDRIK